MICELWKVFAALFIILFFFNLYYLISQRIAYDAGKITKEEYLFTKNCFRFTMWEWMVDIVELTEEGNPKYRYESFEEMLEAWDKEKHT